MPFVIRMDLEAVLLIDVHSHTSENEVAGLLGGRLEEEVVQADTGEFYGQRVLRILTAEPCKSESSQLECDIDPGKEPHYVYWFIILSISLSLYV